jgi:hypothetical protein
MVFGSVPICSAALALTLLEGTGGCCAPGSRLITRDTNTLFRSHSTSLNQYWEFFSRLVDLISTALQLSQGSPSPLDVSTGGRGDPGVQYSTPIA